MIVLDISLVAPEDTLFIWLAPLCMANNPETLLISKRQQELLFSSIGDNWATYRGIKIQVVEEEA